MFYFVSFKLLEKSPRKLARVTECINTKLLTDLPFTINQPYEGSQTLKGGRPSQEGYNWSALIGKNNTTTTTTQSNNNNIDD